LRKWLAWIGVIKCKKEKPVSNWPIWFSAILFFLNVEIVVTPYILSGLIELTGHRLRLSAGFWSDIEMCWWIYFSIWLAREKISNFGKSRLKDIFRSKKKDRFLIAKVKNFFREHVIENFDLENYRGDKIFKALSESLKEYGYSANFLFVFIFSLVPGYWVISLMVCRVTRWISLYMILLAGNFIKNYFFAYVFEMVGFWGLMIIIVTALILTSFMVKRILGRVGRKL